MKTEINEQALLKFLFDHGHAWNPSNQNTWELREDQLSKLKLQDKAAKAMIQSWQGLDLNFDFIGRIIHYRNIIADGEVGPVTAAMLNVKRCPIPDYPPPPDVELNVDDPQLLKAIETQRAFAVGSGSWTQCDPTRKNIPFNSFRVRIDPARMPSTIAGYHKQALDAVVACYAEAGAAVRYIMDATSDAEILKRFENLAGGVIGWNEFPTANSCRKIDGRLDTGYAPSDWRLWANLEAHETGHGVGLQHGRGHIMNPSILLVWPLSFKGSYSWANLVRWFGGQAIPSDNPNPPDTPPVVGDFNGVFFSPRDIKRGEQIRIKLF